MSLIWAPVQTVLEFIQTVLVHTTVHSVQLHYNRGYWSKTTLKACLCLLSVSAVRRFNRIQVSRWEVSGSNLDGNRSTTNHICALYSPCTPITGIYAYQYGVSLMTCDTSHIQLRHEAVHVFPWPRARRASLRHAYVPRSWVKFARTAPYMTRTRIRSFCDLECILYNAQIRVADPKLQRFKRMFHSVFQKRQSRDRGSSIAGLSANRGL